MPRQTADITSLIKKLPLKCPICGRRMKVRPKKIEGKWMLSVQRVFSNVVHEPPILIILCGNPDCKYILAEKLREGDKNANKNK